jgi:flavin-dependent dehydrogenase
MTTAAAPEPWDVAVVGAGPAGAATAYWLAREGCRVVLLERSRFEGPRVGESLAPGVQPLLRELGAWADFLALDALPSYGTRSAWGHARPDEHAHLSTPFLNGWHVDRQRFDAMLARHAAHAGAELRLGVRVSHCEAGKGTTMRLQLADGGELHAVFVVDASGRSSTLTRCFGARHAVFDRLVAVAAQFDAPEADAQCFTLVETVPQGWWYSAPLPQQRMVAMLMTDADLAPSAAGRDLAQWQLALRDAPLTQARLGPAREAQACRWGPRRFAALSQRHLRGDAMRSPYLAVGDAALAVDPVSGSGVVRGLRTARAAADAVMQWRAGRPHALRDYEDARDGECSIYLQERADYYGDETRWAETPFWSRRAAAVAHRQRRLKQLAA